MAAMTAQEALKLIGGQDTVRAYLRGVEAESDMDRDAARAMRAAIAAVRGADVHDAMIKAEPDLFAQACLLLCRLWTDAEDGAAAPIAMQYNAVMQLLKNDPRNKQEE